MPQVHVLVFVNFWPSTYVPPWQWGTQVHIKERKKKKKKKKEGWGGNFDYKKLYLNHKTIMLTDAEVHNKHVKAHTDPRT